LGPQVRYLGMLLDLCENCGRDYKCHGRRCSNCHTYYYRHDIERPKELWFARPKPIKICKNCGLGRAIAKGRCKACDRYEGRNGKERPEYLYNPPYRCINCNDILPKKKSRGRCPNCADYWRYHGKTKERPKKYWSQYLASETQ
jgi:hypothetical protein